MPKKIGITGGIGAGKTTVCKIFEAMGIPVYDADSRARAIMTDDIKVVEQVMDLFGADAYQKDGSLNRAYLAGIVFKDKKKLAALNAIVHPAVHADGEKWHASFSGVPYTLKEAALLIESGGHKFLDKLILVTAPEELRLERVVARDGSTAEAVKARMDKQMPENEKRRFADFIIKNDGSESLVKQVWKVHRQLIESSEKP
ncbi:MAG TPA: dephospho-CoA kinase [Bacteroidetes bacterium]|nr:dephospho-CoA kinase [Bacteroidota bacterium]